MRWTGEGGDQLLQDREELREQARRAKLFEVILKFEPRLAQKILKGGKE